MSNILDDRRDFNGRSASILMRTEVSKYLPQRARYATLMLTQFTRRDWVRLNERVIRMGGLWISNSRFSHWSIPLSRAN